MPIPSLRHTLALAAAAVALAGPADAGAQTQPVGRRAQNVSEIMAAVPDSTMRERWAAAERAGTLPRLDALVVPAQPVSTRQRVVMQDTTPRRRRPMLPEGTVADVRVFFEADTLMREQRGEVRVSEWQPGRVAGTLPNRPGQIVILYRLPGRPAGLVRRGAGRVDVTVREDVERASLRREVLLREGEAPVLFYLADGSDRPYERRFQELPLAVRQLQGDENAVAAVALQYGTEEFVLRPGERRVVSDAAGAVEFFLVSSYYTDPRAVSVAEGFPYYVRLMAYRVDGQR
jgi:hypothetical protein